MNTFCTAIRDVKESKELRSESHQENVAEAPSANILGGSDCDKSSLGMASN